MNHASRVSRIVLAAAFVAAVSGRAAGEEPAGAPGVGATPLAPSSFGPNTAIVSIPADAFSVTDSGTGWGYDISTFARYRVGGTASWFDAPVNLPSGARIDA